MRQSTLYVQKPPAPELSKPAEYWVKLLCEAGPIHDLQGLTMTIEAIQFQAFRDGQKCAAATERKKDD